MGFSKNGTMPQARMAASIASGLDCEKKYLKTNDFCKYVIEAAVKEINRCSDTAVTPVFVKKGRSVTRVRFEF